jgi:hypothetical protein
MIILGRKPGFGMASQLLLGTSDFFDGIEHVTDFIATKYSLALFGVQATRSVAAGGKGFTITFDNKPSWFNFIGPATNSLTPEQTFWFRAYAHFMLGIFTGALLHFGLKATGSLDPTPPLSFVFSLKDLEGTWEFTAN